MVNTLVTLAEAAELCGVAKSTMTRRRSNGDFPNAQKHNGTWKLPVSDLLNAGLLDQVTTPGNDNDETDVHTSASSAHNQKDTSARTSALENDLLKASAERDLAHQQITHWKEIAAERQALADHWKHLAEQQQRQIESLNTKVLEIESRPSGSTTESSTEAPPPSEELSPPATLFRRFRRLFRG